MSKERRSSVKDLRGAWESKTRASTGSALYSPYHAGNPTKKLTINNSEEENATKSTRQTIEDLAVFTSPRLVQRALDVKSKEGPLPSHPSTGGGIQASNASLTRTGEMIHGSEDKGATTSIAARMGAVEQRKVTIRDRAKLFDSRKGDGEKEPPPRVHGKRTSVLDKFYPPAPPGSAPQRMHGKRTSVLDRFTPATTTKTYETNKQPSLPSPPFKQKAPATMLQADAGATTTSLPFGKKLQPVVLPPIKHIDEQSKPKADIFGRNSLKPVTRPRPSQVSSPPPLQSEQVVVESSPQPTAESRAATPSKSQQRRLSHMSSKIDRKAIVLQEIDHMIRQAEANEIEDEMDEECKEVLRQAAVKSDAYTKRWYDVFTDSFIHCPSLATTLIDYSLLEIAEELYGEELPMLYTVSLRAIAVEIADSEEEIPEYVFNMAS